MTAGIADAAVDALLDEPLDPVTKPLPPARGPLTARTLGAHGWTVRDLLLPALVLHETALAHNIAAMAAFCAGRGVALAPHGKTTMAPQIFRAQLTAGAWGITAATVAHVRAYRAWGVERVLMANELVQPAALRWLAAELDADPAFEFLCLVDSEAAVERMTAALGAARRPVRVLVELGNVRAGARSVAAAVAAGRAAARSPALELAGLEGYEGTLGADRAARTVADVDAFLDALRETADALGLGDDAVVTAGGSAYFDRVVERLGGLPGRLVLRAGCYVTHDHGMYEGLSPLTGTLRPALELWAEVLSAPEPGFAVAGFGKRDAPYDIRLPQPLGRVHPTGEREDLAGRVTVEQLNDQHAFLRCDGVRLAVGDLLVCGIAHPCTAFDKWRLIPTVDDDLAVTGAVRTFF
jgi:D-serine dehydratase